MFKIRKAKEEEPTAPGQGKIKKRSRVPGVMITQFVEELPEGMTTPDFTRKPIALTLQEGKTAIFRAIVVGKPAPTVTWLRNNGEIDQERYKIVFDAGTGEHQLQMPDVCVDQADTYKCYAENEYGKAVVTATLNVIEVGFKKNRAMQESRTGTQPTFKEEAKLEIDDKFWDLLLSADKKDYERICAQYAITDFRWMLKKLNEKKVEREKEQEKVVERLCNLKPIELRDDGGAEFELEMSLKDTSSKIFLYKDGVMVPFDVDTEVKHGLKQVGKKFVFSINGINPEDAGLYQVEVDGVKIFSTDLKLPNADFLVKIQDVTAEEREDALFECVVSQPLKKITWKGKNVPLEQGEKFDILVSEDMLIHSLLVKDCMPLDKGIYAAEVGLTSCSAWLIVEVDKDPNSAGKKKVQTFSLTLLETKDCNFETPPSFSVPLKLHSSPESYECYMSCAVTGNPKPHVTWYRNNVSLNTNTNYYITNTCGVCSMVILKVGSKDSGNYSVIAENPIGRVECSTKLVVKGKYSPQFFSYILNVVPIGLTLNIFLSVFPTFSE
uniref:Immunoglobulin like and fibronectin type III domain containing 1, tandem duplicate 3 n=1 Tax=Stegastes partitus TaxID=144197 RepID=A0A3B4YZD7_9TELE